MVVNNLGVSASARAKCAVLAALMLTGACATTSEYVQTSRPVFDHARAYGLPEDATVQARVMLAAMGDDVPQNVSFNVTQIQRAEIGSTGRPETAAHESAFAAENKKPIENFTPGSETPGFIEIQGAGDHGGWIGEEDLYRHSYSGMTCDRAMMIILPVGENDLVFSSVPLSGIQLYDERGLDTSCNYLSQRLGVYITLFASKWPDVTLDQHFSAALSDMTAQMKISGEAPVLVANADTEEEDYGPSSIEGETKAAAFFLEPVNGANLKTILWLNKTGDWHIKARVTYVMPETDPAPELSLIFSVEQFTSIEYAAKLEEVDKYINSGVLTQVRY